MQWARLHVGGFLLPGGEMEELDIFLKLPYMIQEHIWRDLRNGIIDGNLLHSIYDYENFKYCESPIEITFYYFFKYVAHRDYKELGFNVFPQEDISAIKIYRADFLIECFDYRGSDILPDGKEIAPDEYYSKVIVECDGHDFHEKTKAQVKRRNERDFNLKMEGYEVIHFSGSEIYNEPEKCAKKVIEYLIKFLKPNQEE